MAREIEEIILKISLDDSQVKKDLAGLKSQANNTFSAGIFGQKTDPFKPVSDGAKKALKKLPPLKTGFKDVNSAIRSTMREATAASTALDKAGNSAKNSGKKAKTSAKGYNLLSGAIQAIGVSMLIAKLKELGSQALQVNEDFTRVRQVLLSTFGSEAGAQFDFVRKKAQELGIDLLASEKGFAKYAAAAKGAGQSNEAIQGTFTGVAEAASALALSADDTNGVLRALSQISAKGKVSTEELIQIAERGIPVYELAANAIGVQKEELFKMLQQGKIMSDDFLPKFADQLKKTYHEGAMKNASSAIAIAARNTNRWNEQLDKGGAPLRDLTNTLGGAFLTAWESITDTIADGIVKVAEINGTLDTLAGTTEKVTKKNNDLAASNKKVEDSVKKANAALHLFANMGKDISQNQDLDTLQKKLGLTAKGFAQFRDQLKKDIDAGTIDPLGSEKDLESVKKQVFDILDLIEDGKKEGFFQIDEDAKNFLKGFQDLGILKGLNFFKDVLTPDEGLGGFDEKEKKKGTEVSKGPIEALESGSAEALRFAARPVEKDMKAIAEDQLKVQQGMATSMATIAANPSTINSAGL